MHKIYKLNWCLSITIYAHTKDIQAIRYWCCHTFYLIIPVLVSSIYYCSLKSSFFSLSFFLLLLLELLLLIELIMVSLLSYFRKISMLWEIKLLSMSLFTFCDFTLYKFNEMKKEMSSNAWKMPAVHESGISKVWSQSLHRPKWAKSNQHFL